MKKFLITTTCLIMIVLSVITLCACDNDSESSKWKAVGLGKSTLTLPDLEIGEEKSFNEKDKVLLSIAWNNGTEETFKALVNECFTKIPANLDGKGNKVASADEMIVEYDEMTAFNAVYKKSSSIYYCAVILFKEDYEEDDMAYKSGQLVLLLQKQVVREEHITSNIWSIDSDDKTWFTEDELAQLGLEGLQAPEGNILGKIVEIDEDYIHVKLSMEQSDVNVYDRFIKLLYDEYGMNLNVMGQPTEGYHDSLLYQESSENFIRFTPNYQVGGKDAIAFIVWDDEHIVIEININ